MSIYGDLSKPQRSVLRQLLQVSAVSIETAHRCSNRRVEPYWRCDLPGLSASPASACGTARTPTWPLKALHWCAGSSPMRLRLDSGGSKGCRGFAPTDNASHAPARVPPRFQLAS